MSVRERPVASRYLDLKEKELKYRQHVRTLRTCKAQIDTKEVEMAPRFKVAARNQAIFREKMRQRNAEHTRMIEDVRRPKTASTFTDYDDLPLFQTRRKDPYYNDPNDMSLFRREYESTRPRTGKPQNSRRQNYHYYDDSNDSPYTSSAAMQIDSESQPSVHELRVQQKQREKIRIGTVEQNDSSKVLIITDKGKEPPSMVFLPSENQAYSSGSSSSSSSSAGEYKREYPSNATKQTSYANKDVEPKLFSSSTEPMDYSSSVAPQPLNENRDVQNTNMSIKRVIDSTLYDNAY